MFFNCDLALFKQNLLAITIVDNLQVLCRSCNAALGVFGDSVEGVQHVLDYLKGELPNA